ncbi:MAG TPA: GNAT family N-acetyltransferase [Candidatus Dormibacteraeota bacterium]|jgi:GNAT superfamily N-acetyltransferase|nr:GNAT family N-acetyltransferase [Candidatus Dormibacteraeota bacterium]HEX2681798.1 GNAT family N-acetyltransferase [Candidatus Dormibacteraeota bacterium]
MVRRAVISDAAAIAGVHVATWRTAYRGLLPDEFLASLGEAGYEERWRRNLGQSASQVYVADENDDVVGFASGGRERAGEPGFHGELYAIYVLEKAQGHGHGHRLVHAVAQGLHEMGLADMIVWVLRDNPTARRFYERLGGVYVRAQPITIGPTTLQEVSYGWTNLERLITGAAVTGIG